MKVIPILKNKQHHLQQTGAGFFSQLLWIYTLEGNNYTLEGNIYRKMHVTSSFVLTRSSCFVSLLAVFYHSVSCTDFIYTTVKKIQVHG